MADVALMEIEPVGRLRRRFEDRDRQSPVVAGRRAIREIVQ